METIHKSQFVKIQYDESQKMFFYSYLIETATMGDKDFKEEMTIFADLCDEYRPDKQLVDGLNLKYSIDPKIQEWVNVEVFPRVQENLKRVAFLYPKDFISGLSIEQTMEEKTGQNFEQAYFDNEKEALDWLFSKKSNSATLS